MKSKRAKLVVSDIQFFKLSKKYSLIGYPIDNEKIIIEEIIEDKKENKK